MTFRELLGNRLLFFDGGMGTMLQSAGLLEGELPEYWNMEKPDIIVDIHYQYLMAGANIIETNAFGANPLKISQNVYTSYDLMYTSVELAKKAIHKCTSETGRHDMFVAATLGPIGSLLSPLGDISFDEAYESFKVLVQAAKDSDADLILIETMTDAYEIKAAVLAAKENCDLPIIVSAMLDESGKLLTGGDIDVLSALLEGLKVDAVGLNCGFGPTQLGKFLPHYIQKTSLPVMINVNAGIPKTDDEGNTIWNLSPEEFGRETSKFALEGAFLIGGCCGTTPCHIRSLVQLAKDIVPPKYKINKKTIVTSNSIAREIGDNFTIIGESINPTGNKVFKKALLSNDVSATTKLAIDQQQSGCHILDVNVGLPEVDEVFQLSYISQEIQKISNLPLMLDSSNAAAMEKAIRYYNGKPFINSVSGKKESLNNILPIAAKYGGVLVALTLDDEGIPNTSDQRVEIAKKIINEASKYGIGPEDIVVDPLTLTVSANKDAPLTTIETIYKLKQLGIKSLIGVSNVSFGLPNRDKLTSTFFAMALSAGLTSGIVNPFSKDIKNVYMSYNALTGRDESCKSYINFAASQPTENNKKNNSYSLQDAIINGLKTDVKESTSALIKSIKPIEIVNSYIIPALDKVGKMYEDGTIYLPQLLISAEAAQQAFSVIKNTMRLESSSDNLSKGKILLATVKGDIHDIGKNIVKVLLQNYGYEVIDLGKDVAPELIVDEIISQDISLVGLSSLMTTTVPNMEKTIKLIRSSNKSCKVAVGGAVLNEEYALKIDADFYCKDAMATVKYAESLKLF